MKKRNYLKGRAGFSLVEVVVALAIATFALLGILALVTVSQQSTKASSDDTRLSQISEQVFHQVQIDLATDAAFNMGSDPMNTGYTYPPFQTWQPVTVNGQAEYQRKYWFDDQGVPLASQTGATLYIATVTLGPLPSTFAPNVDSTILKGLKITINWPAGAPAGSGQSRTYSMLLRNRGSYGNSKVYVPPYPANLP